MGRRRIGSWYWLREKKLFNGIQLLINTGTKIRAEQRKDFWIYENKKIKFKKHLSWNAQFRYGRARYENFVFFLS